MFQSRCLTTIFTKWPQFTQDAQKLYKMTTNFTKLLQFSQDAQKIYKMPTIFTKLLQFSQDAQKLYKMSTIFTKWPQFTVEFTPKNMTFCSLNYFCQSTFCFLGLIWWSCFHIAGCIQAKGRTTAGVRKGVNKKCKVPKKNLKLPCQRATDRELEKHNRA